MRYRGYFRRIEISLYIKLEVGKNIADIAVGDRVACAGVGYANHAEMPQQKATNLLNK